MEMPLAGMSVDIHAAAMLKLCRTQDDDGVSVYFTQFAQAFLF
jgi:hypothetical protein